MIDDRELVSRWLAAFARQVPADILAQNVLGDCNHLWHIFTWGEVPCLDDDRARAAFDALAYDSAIIFESGYVRDGAPIIENLRLSGKVASAALDELGDVYVVDPDFKWTYVHTHEKFYGPYFCVNPQVLPG